MKLSENLPWVVFSYKIASDTSTLRVRAWRILRRIGALSIQNSVCIVPATSLTVRKLNQLKGLVEENGGLTTWLDVTIASSAQTAWLVEQFNGKRAKEYMEVVRRCEEFTFDLSPPDRESAFAQLEKSLRKVVARDYFDCRDRNFAESAVATLRSRLDQWALICTDSSV